MSRLMGYLPDYYGGVKEMKYITGAEQPEIDSIWQALMRVKHNQFILDSDEKAVAKWERILNILPDKGQQSLDYRKAVVIMKLSTTAPLTHRWLIGKLRDMAGDGNFRVDIDYGEYSILISLRDERNIINDLKPYLRRVIPANLTLSTRSWLTHKPVEAKNIYIKAHAASRRRFISRPVRSVKNGGI